MRNTTPDNKQKQVFSIHEHNFSNFFYDVAKHTKTFCLKAFSGPIINPIHLKALCANLSTDISLCPTLG